MTENRRIPACFARDYCVPTRSGSLEKLGAVADMVAARGLATVVDPGVLSLDRLLSLHDPAYVRAFLDGTGRLATSQNLPWSPALRTAVLSMQAGQLTAADLAVRHGVAANIANGFHHAGHGRGGGFCTFNGLALIAHAHPQRRVFVLDCDEHGGNGTEEFAARLPNLFNYSIFGTAFGCRGGVRSVAHPVESTRSAFRGYHRALAAAFERIERWQADLVVYQAGADCHREDPLGRGIATTADLRARDASVFAFCREQRIPVVFTLGGGYQEEERSAMLHANTFETAVEVFAGNPSTAPA